MISEGTLRFIADSLNIQKGETVLEIGPGLGFLTKELLERGANLLAVEQDRRFAQFLEKKFEGCSVRIINDDILKTDLAALVTRGQKLKVAGNIPYNITSPILQWLIEQRQAVREAVMTVQYEVAVRLAAGPGTKDWGALSVFVQFYSDLSFLKKVGKESFYPSPDVESAVVRLVLLDEPRVRVRDEALFFQTVRKAFQKRRKTLLNALESEQFDKARLTPIFKALSIDPSRRPETLTLGEWASLADGLFS